MKSLVSDRGMVFVGILGIFIGVFSMCCAQSDDLCTNYQGIRGECKIINNCQSLFSLLLHRPLKSKDADHLRRSQCGFEGIAPKVCCPLDDAVSSTTSEPQLSYEEARPADSPHLPSKDECGIESPDRVLGGEVAGLTEFPWMALVEYQKDNGQRGFYCGGVLINQRYILTAAHCIKGKDIPRTWTLVSVRLGEYNTENETDCIFNGVRNICTPPPLNIPVEERIAHEMYNPYDTNQYHDIGLLRLSREVRYSAFVKPICLPKSSFDQSKTFAGSNLTVAGWGRTENKTESPVKMKLFVPVRSSAICTKTYRQANLDLRGGQICAGGVKGKDSCRGDSGGPLMDLYADENSEINWYSIGVVSFGPSPCGLENWPGVYTKVANYVSWIVKKLRA